MNAARGTSRTGNLVQSPGRESAAGPVYAALAFCVVAAGLLAGPSAGWRAVPPMMVAVLGALAVAALHARSRIVAAVAVVVAVSSALGTLFGDPPATETATGVATLVEITGLLLLVCLVARYAEIRQAVLLCTLA